MRPVFFRPTLCGVLTAAIIDTAAIADTVPRSDPNGLAATVAGAPLWSCPHEVGSGSTRRVEAVAWWHAGRALFAVGI